MARKLPGFLKLHDDGETVVAAGPAQLQPADLAATMAAFADATGWIPRPLGGTPHHPLDENQDSDAPLLPLRKRMRLVSRAPMDGLLDADDLTHFDGTSEECAWALLEQIDGLIQQLKSTERAVERQEAELAKSLGVSIRHDEADILAGRLSESLHRAAELTGSDAAALYLLDDTTSQLKMRSCWGMSTAALSKPPRELRGSLADLEALMGNAVLLENTALAPEWNCPEDFAAALCVPIGSPTMPHGTLWLWSDHVRDFSSSDIDAAKAAGDKILVDIERNVLADEVLKTRALNRQVESASLVQSSRLPDSQPLHEDYEVSGWTHQGQALGGNFHAWTINRQQMICAALGSAATNGPAGALVATSLQTVIETCWNSNHRPVQVMRKANDILWAAQDGDWRAAACYLQIQPASGALQYALAGNIQAFIINSRGFRPLRGTSTMLAVQPDCHFDNQQMVLEAGELLLVASAEVVGGIERGGFTQDALLKLIRDMHDEAVQDIVDHTARLLPLRCSDLPIEADRSLLLIRRRF